jgi:hypothetical protein
VHSEQESFYPNIETRGSSVSIANSLHAERSTNRGIYFNILHSVQTGSDSEAHLASYLTGGGGISPGIKEAGD